MFQTVAFHVLFAISHIFFQSLDSQKIKLLLIFQSPQDEIRPEFGRVDIVRGPMTGIVACSLTLIQCIQVTIMAQCVKVVAILTRISAEMN
jgi:hypothetical protein